MEITIVDLPAEPKSPKHFTTTILDSVPFWRKNEVYNLAAQSHVRVSFDAPEYTTDITATGTVRLLEAIGEVGIQPRFYQASSSEMFG